MVIPIEQLKEHVVERIVKEVRNAQVRLKKQGITSNPDLKIAFTCTVVIAGGLNAVTRTASAAPSGDKITTVLEPETVETTVVGPENSTRQSSQGAQQTREDSRQQVSSSDATDQIYGRSNTVQTTFQQ